MCPATMQQKQAQSRADDIRAVSAVAFELICAKRVQDMLGTQFEALSNADKTLIAGRVPASNDWSKERPEALWASAEHHGFIGITEVCDSRLSLLEIGSTPEACITCRAETCILHGKVDLVWQSRKRSE